MVSILIGLASAALVVYVGAVCKRLRVTRIVISVATSILLAHLVFFMCMAIPKSIAVEIVSILPLATGIASFAKGTRAIVTNFLLAASLPWVNFALAIAVITTEAVVLNQKVANALFDTCQSNKAKPTRKKRLHASERDRRSEDLKDTIRHYSLTNCERDALLLSGGYTANTIADEPNITHNTTQGYIRNVYLKCLIHSHQDAIDLENTALVNKR